jgi:sugar lactone lactonase YvrE
MINKKGLLPLLFLFCYSALLAQLPERIKTTLLNGPDGMVVDKSGNIYVANWGKDGKGSSIVKIDKTGKEEIFYDSLASPDGLTFDNDGNLYISCFASGQIIKVNPKGIGTVFAENLNHPSDLKFDRAGNLYISEFGNYNGTKIYKISKGTTRIFSEGHIVPLGLTFDKNNNLYVSNFGSGEIYKVDPNGNKTLFIQLPEGNKSYSQYLALDKSGNLYCASYGVNAIYKITGDGKCSKIMEGTTLSGPNSIFIIKNTLYFTEFNTNSLYRLPLN